jgi:threonylcarbamoyladenosine tRNA methylthiotransferase MtaB
MRVYLHSIGCRLNQSEIETMARQLLAAGHEIVSDPSQAEQVIINSCAVTTSASRDARTLTRRIHRDNGAAAITLTGCYASMAASEVGKLPGVAKVVDNTLKDRLVQMIDPNASPETAPYDQEPVMREMLARRGGRTRAFVKVQDGCDNKCTFCITTIARGKGRSRLPGDVVAEIQALASAGYQEAVLTGVHLGSYGVDLNGRARKLGLEDLVKAILQRTEIPRLRLSSLEPWDIGPAFFDLWQDPRLLPHLHLPLQSGSDKILRRMARRTSQASFSHLVERARAQIPHVNVSSDIIVGFPGETETDFEESLEFVRQLRFSRLHVFNYSSRPGTAAAHMPGHLSGTVKRARARRMIELGHQLSLDFHKSFEGTTRNVLWENGVANDGNGLRWLGYTDNYIRVTGDSLDDLFNQVLPARLTDARPDGISGQIGPVA